MPEPLKNLGTCPRCGSAEVNAIWYGMPMPDYEETWPTNVQVGGCALIGNDPNRVCGACGHRWISPDDNTQDAE